MRKVEKYIVTTQRIGDLEGEQPQSKKQPRVNWLFRALSEEAETGGTPSKTTHMLHTI